MRKLLIIIISFTIACNGLIAQDNTDQKRKSRHEYGLNMSPLLFQLVPFKNNESRTGPYNFVYNFRRNNKAFSAGLGLRVDVNDFEDSDLSHFNIRMGYRKYRQMTPHWEFYRGFDFMLTLGSFNLPESNDDSSIGLGFGFPLGIVYRINDFMSLSTEGSLFLGAFADFDSGDASPIQIIPPVSVIFNVRL